MIVTTTTTTTRILSQAFISIWDLRRKKFSFCFKQRAKKKLEQLFGGKYSNIYSIYRWKPIAYLI